MNKLAKKNNKSNLSEMEECASLTIAIVLISLITLAHLYNLIYIIANGAYAHPLLPVSASVFVLNIIFLVLILEKRKFARIYGIFVYSYGAFLSISLYFLNRLNLIGCILNLIISLFIIAYLYKSKRLKKILIY